MACYEYLVVPAPRRGLKEKGIKGGDLRFAAALSTVLNQYAGDGWDYLRTDTLPSEEREGLVGRSTVFQNMLVFRRLKSAGMPAPEARPALIEDRSAEIVEDAPADPADRTAPVAADLPAGETPPPLTQAPADGSDPKSATDTTS